MAARILYPFAGDTMGGSPISTLEIIRGLDRTLFEPVIALHKTQGTLRDFLQAQGTGFADVSFISCPPKPRTLMKDIFAARRFLRAQDIKLIHCDDGPLRYVWLYAAKLAGVKYLHVQRTLTRVTVEKKLSYPRMDYIVSNSLATQKSLPKLPASLPQVVIYPPIDLKYTPLDKSRSRRDICAFLGLEDNDKIKLVCFAAHMHPRKRPEVFIEMAAQLYRRDQNFRFMMVGDFYGKMEGTLREAAHSYGLNRVLFFTGFEPEGQKFISAADVLVAPAVDEAFGRAVAEALGLGTPVVAADDGGHREIIENGKTGFLVQPDDVAGFVRKVQEILGRRDIVENGLKRAQEFSRQKAVDAFNDIYRGLL